MKAEMVKKLHESVQKHIEKKNEQYATKADKGRVIGFRCIWEKKDFQPVNGPSYILERMVHFKSLR